MSLILISQLSRSGGSLFSQLLDGHPHMRVFPWELTIGYPSKTLWPRIDPDEEAAELFARLYDPVFSTLVKKGYRKRGKTTSTEHVPTLPFRYDMAEHFARFARMLPPPPRSRRQVIEAYLSTFFEAWGRSTMLDQSAVVAGFVPQMAANRSNIEAFFEDFPDGRLVTILRNPADWAASRRRHAMASAKRKTPVLAKEIAAWNNMTALARDYCRDWPGRVLVLSFESLVRDREKAMRSFCEWAGVDFHPALLEQTFDGQPTTPNTNYDLTANLDRAVMTRRADLSLVERAEIFFKTRF